MKSRIESKIIVANPVLYKQGPLSHIRRPMDILSILLTVVLVAVSILIVLIVLLQRPKQEGLGTAFGGGSLDSALGAHTSDVLQKITTWFGVIFFISAISLSMIKARQFKDSAASNILEEVEKREPTLPGGLPASLGALPKADDKLTLPATKPDSKPATKPDSKPDAKKATGPKSAPPKKKAATTPAPVIPKKTPSPAASDKPAKK